MDHEKYPELAKAVEEEKAKADAWKDRFQETVRWDRGRWHVSLPVRIAKGFLNMFIRGALIFSYDLESDLDKLIKQRKAQVKSNPANLKYHSELAKMFVLKEDEKKAIATACKARDRYTKIGLPTIDKVINKLDKIDEKLAEKIGDEYEEEEENLDGLARDVLMVYAVMDMISGDFKQAIDAADRILKEEPEHAELLFLKAEAERAMGRMASFTYIASVTAKMDQEGLPTTFYGESRNKLHLLEWEDWPSGVLFLKEYTDSEDLDKEWSNTRVFREFLGECVQTPIFSAKTGDIPVNCFKTAGEYTLLDVIDRTKGRGMLKTLQESARLLAHIHVFGTKLYERGLPPEVAVPELSIDDVVGEDPHSFTHKLEGTLLKYASDDPTMHVSRSAADKILNAHSLVNDFLMKVERDFYKDHNPRNVVIDEFGNPVAIDFESAKLVPCQIDLVSLLEFGGDYLTARQRHSVIEAYIQEKEILLGEQIDKGTFMYTYQFAKIQRHLELVGYRSRDIVLAGEERNRVEEFERRQYHLRAGSRAILELRESSHELAKIGPLTELYEGVQSIQEDDLKRNGH